MVPIPFVGNPLVLLLGTSLYLFSVLGLGLLISTLCSTQQQAFATNFFVVNPLFMLSGFGFPISSMPERDAKAHLPQSRALLSHHHPWDLSQGRRTGVLWPQMLGLAVLGAALLTASILRFRKSLD